MLLFLLINCIHTPMRTHLKSTPMRLDVCNAKRATQKVK